MPSKPHVAVSGRCYCGNTKITAGTAQTVARCHCSDCRRWTGAPAPVFAAFEATQVTILPEIEETSINAGVRRRNCPDCGSPLTARFAYLPGQTYVPIGILDQASALPPQVECHTAQHLDWVEIDPSLRSNEHSARDTLSKAKG